MQGLETVMTDLFVSAGATLLIVLAVTREVPEDVLPVQADLVATCPPSEDIARGDGTLLVRAGGASETAQPIPVEGVAQMAVLPAALGMPARTFYTITLTSDAAPVTAACLDWVQEDLVRAHNAALASDIPRGGARPVYALGAVGSTTQTPGAGGGE
jgi:hypothetical protein